MSDFLAKVPPLLFGIIAFLTLLLSGAAALLFNTVYGPRAKLQKRIANVVGTVASANRSTRKEADRRRSVETKLREIERLKQKKRGYRLHEELMQAGFAISSRHFISMSIVFGTVLTILYLLSGLPRIGVPLVAVIAMLGLPKLYLRFRVKRRFKKFTALFADAIDVIIRGVRTGLTVGECLNIVGREMPDPVGAEFRAITEGIHIGLSLEECLNRMYRRVPLPEVRFFIIVLVMQQSTGGNLAETLEKLSDIIRSRKRMRDKIQALSSEAKASAGIISSLPFCLALALAFIAPAYISLLITTDAGNWLLVIGAAWMAIGVFVMTKLIHFDY